MVGASVGLFWEGIGSSFARTLAGVVLEPFIFVTRRQLGHHRHLHFGAPAAPLRSGR